MGGSFESIRMGIKDVSARWLKASKALKKEDQVYGQKLAEMAKKHSSEAFYALDPLEAAVFSVLVEIMKKLTEADDEPAKKVRQSGSAHIPHGWKTVRGCTSWWNHD